MITRTVKRIKNLEPGIEAVFQDRTRSIKKRIYSISKVLKRRTGSAFREVREITGEIMEIAEMLVGQAGQVLTEAGQLVSSASGGAVQKVLDTLETTVEITKTVIAQTLSVQQGNTHIKDRIVSIFDLNERPIKKGKLQSPTEFGSKVLIQDCEYKIVTRY